MVYLKSQLFSFSQQSDVSYPYFKYCNISNTSFVAYTVFSSNIILICILFILLV